ncbi:MAG: dihydrolipoamide acetyltransferase family protein [bacterium]
MPELKQFLLPDVGEGLTEADILSWAVAPGDTVVVNQTLVEVETAKAAVELPSPFAGVVAAVHAQAGDTVAVGRPIITIDVDPSGAAPTIPAVTATPGVAAAPAVSSAESPVGAFGPPDGSANAPDGGSPTNGRQAVLVGYGPRPGATTRRVRRPVAEAHPIPTAQAAFAVEPAPPADAPLVPTPPEPTAAPASDGNGSATGNGSGSNNGVASKSLATDGARVLAKPPVRKLAKQLGVDLATVTPTGPNGSVSREDVQSALEGARSISDGGALAADALIRGTATGGERETRLPVRGVRKHTAAAMVASAFTAPHVTEFVTVDVTETMTLRDRVAARRDFSGVKVSPLLFVARALLWAVRRNPIVNSTWNEAAGEIIVKNYVNLGIAAATGRGLVVPNIKDADRLNLLGLATALAELTATARAGRATPADLAGGTITITNVGVFGIDSGTPILNPGEVAILAVGAVNRRPWVVSRDGIETIEPRWVSQLGLSFDHRVVDGEQGSTFLADIAALLQDPALAML